MSESNHLAGPVGFCGVVLLAVWLEKCESQKPVENLRVATQQGTHASRFDHDLFWIVVLVVIVASLIVTLGYLVIHAYEQSDQIKSLEVKVDRLEGESSSLSYQYRVVRDELVDVIQRRNTLSSRTCQPIASENPEHQLDPGLEDILDA